MQSIIDYGVAIWGYKEFPSINAVQNRACRYFLGVGKYTPTAAVQGDMGWYVPLHKQFLGVARFWCRMYNMNNTRLNKQIFTWSKNKSSSKCKNAMFHIQRFFKQINIQVPEPNNEVNLNKRVFLSEVDIKLLEYCTSKWKNELNRVSARRGPGNNKIQRLF